MIIYKATNKINGKIYRFVDENDKEISPQGSACVKQKRVENVETGELFNSIVEAGLKYNMDKANISRACKKGYRAGGFHWRYS